MVNSIALILMLATQPVAPQAEEPATEAPAAEATPETEVEAEAEPTTDAPAEEVKAEDAEATEPAAEAPATEEPVAETPVVEEPAAEAPVADAVAADKVKTEAELNEVMKDGKAKTAKKAAPATTPKTTKSDAVAASAASSPGDAEGEGGEEMSLAQAQLLGLNPSGESRSYQLRANTTLSVGSGTFNLYEANNTTPTSSGAPVVGGNPGGADNNVFQSFSVAAAYMPKLFGHTLFTGASFAFQTEYTTPNSGLTSADSRVTTFDMRLFVNDNSVFRYTFNDLMSMNVRAGLAVRIPTSQLSVRVNQRYLAINPSSGVTFNVGPLHLDYSLGVQKNINGSRVAVSSGRSGAGLPPGVDNTLADGGPNANWEFFNSATVSYDIIDNLNIAYNLFIWDRVNYEGTNDGFTAPLATTDGRGARTILAPSLTLSYVLSDVLEATVGKSPVTFVASLSVSSLNLATNEQGKINVPLFYQAFGAGDGGGAQSNLNQGAFNFGISAIY